MTAVPVEVSHEFGSVHPSMCTSVLLSVRYQCKVSELAQKFFLRVGNYKVRKLKNLNF